MDNNNNSSDTNNGGKHAASSMVHSGVHVVLGESHISLAPRDEIEVGNYLNLLKNFLSLDFEGHLPLEMEGHLLFWKVTLTKAFPGLAEGPFHVHLGVKATLKVDSRSKRAGGGGIWFSPECPPPETGQPCPWLVTWGGQGVPRFETFEAAMAFFLKNVIGGVMFGDLPWNFSARCLALLPTTSRVVNNY